MKNAKLVKADGSETDLTNPAVSEGDTAQTHVFTYSDIMKLLPKDYSYTKGDKIVFQYDATVNQNAQTGKDLSNQVKLTYSNDPDSNGTGTSTDTPKVHEYTYQLVLNKVDLGTEKALDGATFTIKNAAGKYIDANGGTNNTAVPLSATNGVLNVKGLDADTYTVDETSVRSPYDTAAEFTFTIAPTFNDDGTINTLGNTVDRTGDVIAGTVTGDTGDNVLTPAEDSGSDVSTGTVTVTVGDKKEITMPLTGMKGTTALMVYGSAILVISAAAYLKHKRNANSDDAE